MDKLMIIDCHSVAHAVKHATKNLSFAGRKTGIIFAFLKKILVIAEEFKSNRIAFTWDSKDSIRKEMYKGYKANRGVKLSKEDILLNTIAIKQFEKLKTDVLLQLGFNNIFCFNGYEADDIIASIVLNETNKYKCIMVTRDNDMLQLLSNNCSMYEHTTKVVTTAKDFVSEWSIMPYEWAAAKALAGCKSDNVPGIKGIGEKTAIAFLKNNLKSTSRKMLDIIDNSDTISLTLKLVQLPLDYSLIDKVLLSEDSLTLQKYVNVCETYNFESMLTSKNIKRWREIFKI